MKAFHKPRSGSAPESLSLTAYSNKILSHLGLEVISLIVKFKDTDIQGTISFTTHTVFSKAKYWG